MDPSVAPPDLIGAALGRVPTEFGQRVITHLREVQLISTKTEVQSISILLCLLALSIVVVDVVVDAVVDVVVDVVVAVDHVTLSSSILKLDAFGVLLLAMVAVACYGCWCWCCCC